MMIGWLMRRFDWEVIALSERRQKQRSGTTFSTTSKFASLRSIATQTTTRGSVCAPAKGFADGERGRAIDAAQDVNRLGHVGREGLVI